MQAEEKARVRHKQLAIDEEAKVLAAQLSAYKAETEAAEARKRAKAKTFALSVDEQVEARRAKAGVGTAY